MAESPPTKKPIIIPMEIQPIISSILVMDKFCGGMITLYYGVRSWSSLSAIEAIIWRG